MQDPENAAQLARVTEAAQRVAELQAESERLAAEMAAAAADQAASAEAAERRGAEAAAKLIAEAEVAAKAKLLQAAQLQAESADAARRKWATDISEVSCLLVAWSALCSQEQSPVACCSQAARRPGSASVQHQGMCAWQASRAGGVCGPSLHPATGPACHAVHAHACARVRVCRCATSRVRTGRPCRLHSSFESALCGAGKLCSSEQRTVTLQLSRNPLGGPPPAGRGATRVCKGGGSGGHRRRCGLAAAGAVRRHRRGRGAAGAGHYGRGLGAAGRDVPLRCAAGRGQPAA